MQSYQKSWLGITTFIKKNDVACAHRFGFQAAIISNTKYMNQFQIFITVFIVKKFLKIIEILFNVGVLY